MARPLEESVVEKAWKRRVQAGASFDELCREHQVPFTSKGTLSHGGHTLLLMQERGSSETELLSWVKDNCRLWFSTEEARRKFVEVATENRRSSYAVREELTNVIAEDRGWPHRSFLYLSRVCPGPRKRMNPQHYFLGLGLRAVQEGDDPDRYVPDTNPNVVTLVGKLFDGPQRLELELHGELTVAGAVEAVCKSWACNPSNTTIGFHGRPFGDTALRLADLGVTMGTVLHVMPGWASVDEMQTARRSSAASAAAAAAAFRSQT